MGKPSPELDLVRLSDDFKLTPMGTAEGSITLLHFWGVWCPPCRMEFPELAMMTAEYASDDRFAFLPVTCEGEETTLENLWLQTSQFLSENALAIPTYADPTGRSRRSAAERLGQPALCFPTSVLIDQRGRITNVWEGFAAGTVDEIRREIDCLLDRLRSPSSESF